MLEITDLVKDYKTGLRALDGVSLTVSKPQVVAVIGSSGAGKSTLIRCINRLIEPTSGSIRLDGLELSTLNRRDLRKARRRIGMIFQEYNLVERLTVMENVLSGRLGYVNFWQAYFRRYPADDVATAFEILDRVFASRTRDQWERKLVDAGDLIWERVQRQRVGIARALMQKPDLLLVDEPTASLDPKTSRQIMRLIVELAHERGTPALVNIHDVALAQASADRIVALKEGRTVFDGAPDALSPQVLTDIYGEEDWSATIRRGEDEDEGDGKKDRIKEKGFVREASAG